MTALAKQNEPTAPTHATTKAMNFLAYWGKYRSAAEMNEISAIAYLAAINDDRDLVCLNDVQAAWTRVVGALWCEGMEP